MSRSFPSITYTGLHVYRPYHVYISCIADELDEQVGHSAIIRWKDTTWAHKSVGHAVVDMISWDTDKGHSVFNLCANGQLVRFTFPGDCSETLPSDDGRPSERVPMKRMAVMGGKILAVGEGPQAYIGSPGQWKCISDQLVADADNVRGLLCVFAISTDSAIAVGRNGEIWHYEGKFRKVACDATSHLTTATILADGRIVVAGMNGCVLIGDLSSLESVNIPGLEKDIWDLTPASNGFMAATSAGLFRVSPDLSAEPVFIGDNVTTMYVKQFDNVFWSVGPKHIAYSEGGYDWTVLGRPYTD